MSRFKALFTDLDGTLIHSEPGIIEALKIAFDHVGVETPETQALLKMFGLPVEAMLLSLTSVKETETDLILEFIEEYKRQYPLHMSKTPLIPNALETVKKVNESGYIVCLITSERRKNIQYVLDCVGLSPYIPDMITRDDVQNFKPNPEALMRGLDRYNIPANECMYIGESPFDIEAGLAAGTFTAAIASGGFSKEQLLSYNPDVFLDDISDLLDYFPMRHIPTDICGTTTFIK